MIQIVHLFERVIIAFNLFGSISYKKSSCNHFLLEKKPHRSHSKVIHYQRNFGNYFHNFLFRQP